MNRISLDDGHTMPQLGLGTWQLQGQDCMDAVTAALENNYRHIDTAYKYQNHETVARAIHESPVAREDIYISTKIWRDQLRPDELKEQFRQSLKELNTNYVDLLMIHWPNSSIPIEDTYAAMQELKDNGQAVSIGVSNFTIRHLEEALSVGFTPAVNQVEFHPSLYPKELYEFCREHDIQLVAYSPLAQGEDAENQSIQSIAKKHNKTPAQIIIAWILHKQIVAIPRSSNPKHIEENMAAIDIELDEDDMDVLDGLDKGNRLIEPPFAEFQ